jgi:hypothetical protein
MSMNDLMTRAEANALHRPPTDEEAAHRWAVGRLTDGESLCLETFSEFIATATNVLKPTRSHPVMYGPASDAELVKLILSCQRDDMTLAAVKELRARYLADDYTKRCIADEVRVYLGEPA